MRDSSKQKRISLVLVIMFAILCIVSPLAFSSAYFSNRLSFIGTGKTPAIYVSVKSNFDTSKKTIIVDGAEKEVDAYVLNFDALNENGLKRQDEIENPDKSEGQPATIIEEKETPIYIANYIDYTKKSTINGLLRVKIGIEWADSSPSNAGITLEIPETLWLGTEATMQDSLMSGNYLYYKNVVKKDQMTVADFSTFIPLINSIKCNSDLYFNKDVTITVYAEIIQANDLGLSIWQNETQDGSHLPAGWAEGVRADENYMK